jgi:hypothetical protein
MRTSTFPSGSWRLWPLKEGVNGGTLGSPVQGDVQEVYANFDIPERVLEAVAP